jgi:hypothetical protein
VSLPRVGNVADPRTNPPCPINNTILLAAKGTVKPLAEDSVYRSDSVEELKLSTGPNAKAGPRPNKIEKGSEPTA